MVEMIQPSPSNNPLASGVHPPHHWYVSVKSLVDVMLGAGLLVLLSPVILLCAGLVKLTSRGPMFYSQTRVGKDGKLFKIIKLRSMYQNAEAKTGAVWASGNDSRITPLGRILRSTHLDEFPQLINVVKGDMSVVGPRPERPEFVHGFEMQIEHYASRHFVKPGITGIAQLRLPPDSDMMSVCEKLEFDLYYVRHMSPWLDFVAMFATGVQLATSLVKAILPTRIWIPTQEDVRADFAISAKNQEAVPAASRLTVFTPDFNAESFTESKSTGVYSAS